MKLRDKLFVLLIVAVVIPFVIGIRITYSSIKTDMEQLEIQKALSKGLSAKTYIKSLLNTHESSYLVWTEWEDYGSAILNKDIKWINENVLSSSKKNTPNEIIVVFDKNMKVIGKTNTPKAWEKTDFKEVSVIKRLNKEIKYCTDLIQLDGKVYIATAVEVVKESELSNGTTCGYTMYARELNESMLQEGEKIVGAEIAIRIDDKNIIGNNNINITNKNRVVINTDIINYEFINDTMIVETQKDLVNLNGNVVGTLYVVSASKTGVSALHNLVSNSRNLILLILVLLIFVLVWLKVIVTDPIKKITEIISKKDLREALKVRSSDEIGTLCKVFNGFIEDQKEIIYKVSQAAIIAGDASKRIDQNTDYLSNTSQVQASIVNEFSKSIHNNDLGIKNINQNMSELSFSVDAVAMSINEMGICAQETARHIECAATSINEVTSSIEEMGYSINSIALHSKKVHEEAQNTVLRAKEGNSAVECTIGEMDKISQTFNELALSIHTLGKSAEEISEIVNVIDEIEEQTNLLSLNAAIEAARAGEAGKGFAVVANSIRSLAEKSGEATEDINKIIKSIQHQVKNAVELANYSYQKVTSGVEYVKSTGVVFENIFSSIDKTGTLVQEITDSIQDHDKYTREVMTAVERINDVISLLSASAEQEAASSEDIVKAVEKINNLMHQVLSITKEQKRDSEQVVELIEEINKGTAEISENSEDISKSINLLSGQIEELINIIKEFKVS